MKVNKEHIKKALDTPVPEWDKESLWQDIKSKLPPQKKKSRPLVLWFFLAGFILAFMLSQGWYASIAEKLFGPVQAYDYQVTPYPQNYKIDDNTSVPDIKNQIKETATFNHNPHFSQSKIIGHANAEPVKNNEVTPNANKNTDVSLTNSAQNISSNILVQKPEKSNRSDETQPVASPKNTVPTQTNANPGLITTSATSLPLLKAKLIWNNHETTPLIYPIIKPTSNSSWTLGFATGISTLQSKLSSTRIENQAWINEKTKVNQPKESISIAIDLQKNISAKWWLGFGLQYQRLNEVLTARDVVTTVKTIQSDSAQYVNANSGIIYIPGNLQQTQTKGYDIFAPNSWTRWSIPISASLQISLGKLKLQPSAKVFYTFYQRFQGIQLHPNGSYIYKNDAVFTTLYKKSGIFSVGFALETEYHLSPSIRLNTGLHYSKDINSVWNTSYGIEEKFRQMGINLGFRYLW